MWVPYRLIRGRSTVLRSSSNHVEPDFCTTMDASTPTAVLDLRAGDGGYIGLLEDKPVRIDHQPERHQR